MQTTQRASLGKQRLLLLRVGVFPLGTSRVKHIQEEEESVDEIPWAGWKDSGREVREVTVPALQLAIPSILFIIDGAASLSAALWDPPAEAHHVALPQLSERPYANCRNPFRWHYVQPDKSCHRVFLISSQITRHKKPSLGIGIMRNVFIVWRINTVKTIFLRLWVMTWRPVEMMTEGASQLPPEMGKM